MLGCQGNHTTDNYFNFLHNFSEEELATFVQELLRQVGDAIGEGNTDALARFVQQANFMCGIGVLFGPGCDDDDIAELSCPDSCRR